MAPPASLYLAGREWLWPAVGAFGAALAFVGWSYFRAPASPGMKLICAALKLIGLAALLACLLEPTWSEQHAKPGANLFAIVADNSLSMKLHGRGETRVRGEALQAALTGENSAWRNRLAENFGVRNYLVDSRLQSTQDFRELSFDGRTTALGGALKTLSERYRGQPLAGILLLTDGVASDLDGVDLPPGLPPVYPVVFGSEQPPRDLAVASASVTQTAFEDAPVTVQAEVSAIGCAGEEIVGKLFAIDPAKKAGVSAEPAAEQTLTAPGESQKLVFRFQLRPEKTGVLFYRLRIAAKREWDAPPEKSTEATLANNETTVTVDRGSDKQRVLYLSGRPNWEYKFLSRAIVEDTQTELVALIRIAKREAKFEFRGRAGESSNPLFRGYGNQSKEEIESYDRPVMVRLNTRDEFELREGFPKTAEELFKYRAVILDDLEAEFFTADQMSLLQRFVSERGGGFLMLGGAESFVEGKYGRTAIGDMLPVYLDQTAGPPRAAEWHLNLTREGWLQPWARLRNNEGDERRRIDELPPFDLLNRTRGLKPAAMVVATVAANDGSAPQPALVTQRFGRGRSAALLVGDLWQSGLGDEARQKDLGKAWRQTIRWLVADVPDPIEVRVEPQSGEETLKLQVRVRDEKFQPLDNAQVALTVLPVGAAAPISLTTEASASEPGVYEATYLPRENGGYRVDAAVTNENGAVIGNAQTGWTTDLAAAEFRSLSPNRALMESLARKTGGESLTPARLEAFVHDLPAKKAPVNETRTRPLWHTPAVFFFALACFLSEWGLRRWKGLA